MKEKKPFLYNVFHDDDHLLKVMEEQPICKVYIAEQVETTDLTYIKWHIFDEITEQVYTIECEGYFDNNGKPLDDETTIKYLTDGEHKCCFDNDIELCDENGNFLNYSDYDDNYYYMDYNNCYLCMIT